MEESELAAVICKYLMEAFKTGLKQSPLDADNSEYWSPHFEYDVTPRVVAEIFQLLPQKQQEVKNALMVLSKYKSHRYIVEANPLANVIVYFRSDVLKAMEEYASQFSQRQEINDFEIEEEAKSIFEPYVNEPQYNYPEGTSIFIEGAKWMRDHILKNKQNGKTDSEKTDKGL